MIFFSICKQKLKKIIIKIHIKKIFEEVDVREYFNCITKTKIMHIPFTDFIFKKYFLI